MWCVKKKFNSLAFHRHPYVQKRTTSPCMREDCIARTINIKVVSIFKVCIVILTILMFRTSLAPIASSHLHLRSSTLSSSTLPVSFLPFSTPSLFKLLSSTPTGHNSCILSFESPLPLPRSLPVPWGVKLHLPGPEGAPKSYSPVDFTPSNPTSNSHTNMTMLVKPYPPSEGGGYGSHLCGDLSVGDSTYFSLKPPRAVHGSTEPIGKYKEVFLVGGGTGIAPLIQIARAEVKAGKSARITMLSVNRGSDILMKDEIEDLVKVSLGKFGVIYLDTATSGRGDVDLAKILIGSSTTDRMVYVCGTDGFVEHWAGGKGRDEFNAKTQGPLGGLLKSVGLTESQVYKF